MRDTSIILLAVLLAVIPLFAQSSEFLIDTNVVFNPDANEQVYPAVAFDGVNYLVVWQDNRNDTGDIFAARVDPTGAILDPTAIAVSEAANLQTLPAVVFDCGNYFAVWQDGQFMVLPNFIYGTLITPNGLVVDTSAVLITAYDNYQPSISSDGNSYFLTWTHYDEWSPASVWGCRIAQNAIVLDTAGILIDYYDSINFDQPTIAFDGTNYFVLYRQDTPDPAEVIVGKRMDQNGVILDSNSILVSPITQHKASAPGLAFDDVNYMAVWEYKVDSPTPKDIHGTRVAPSGIILDSAGFSICAAQDSQTNPCIGFNGADHIVVWEDWRSGSESDIYAARISPSGAVLDSFIVSNAPGNQLSPAITRGQGNQVLITYSGWTDSINGQPINAMRIWGKFYPELGLHEDAGYTIPDTRYNLTVTPNPFTHQTQIRYLILDSRFLMQSPTLKIYDVSGRVVKSFNPGSSIQDQGSAISWHGDDNAGRKLPCGVYFVRFSSGDYEETEKVLLIR